MAILLPEKVLAARMAGKELVFGNADLSLVHHLLCLIRMEFRGGHVAALLNTRHRHLRDRYLMVYRMGMRIAVVASASILAGAAAFGNDSAVGPDGSTPLQWAVFHGDLTATKRLLAAHADVKATNNYGVDAMQLAAEAANVEMIRLLLSAGADPDSPNPEGETALHLVARAGNLDAARLLLRAGAHIDARERFGGQTPLMWAVARRHPEMVELLASKGADINARSVIRDYQRVATAESRAKFLDRGGLTPLMYAARENCRECVAILVKHKADIDLADPSDVAPVSIAMLNGNWDIAKQLIGTGADVNHWDIFGQSPLHVAISNMNSRDNGNPLDQDRPNRATGREVVQILVARGANPNQQLYYRAPGHGGGGRGATPFLLACANGDVDTVKLLLQHGANPRLATADGQGPIIMAIGTRGFGGGPPGFSDGTVGGNEENIVALIKVLRDAGADVNLIAKRHFLQRSRGGSALHYAVRAGLKQVVAELHHLGIRLDDKDEDGLTALDYAMGRGYVPFLQLPQPAHKDLAELLRSLGATVELAKTPDWPPQSPPIGTTVYDAVIWPVDPVGP